MKSELTLYHGSREIVEIPIYGYGKPHNDYGIGFYCTEDDELAREWACPVLENGFLNKYKLDTSKLNVINLSDEEYTVLNWIAILLKNRTFSLTSTIGAQARDYLIENFLPDLSDNGVVIGYRADDSYFAYAEDFVNNTISVRDLGYAMHLGNLGEQVALTSKKAHKHIYYVDHEIVDASEYYYKRMDRDSAARKAYQARKKTPTALSDDIFVLDIIRERMDAHDPRIRRIVFE